jgi:CubicO group peptidase (beta-lactamase class C family)
MTLSNLEARWASRLHDIGGEVGVAGAALGIWRDGHETVVAHGVLNAATGVAVTPDSLFQIGSITKVWTATMVIQLLEEGRLDLDQPVSELLPGVRLGVDDVADLVTVRHLLTHASGVDGDIFTDTGRGDDCIARYVDLLAVAGHTHPVGAAYSYCNSGFVLLGRIVEELDGRTWDESLRARLVSPLGLGQTVTLPEEAILQRAAVGHREHPHEYEPVRVWALPRSVAPAGLITASAHDVLTFARLHLDGGTARDGTRLLAHDSVAAMQQSQRDIPSIDARADSIGLGWRLNRWGGRPIFGHDGGTVGQLAYLRVDPEARLAVCLLTNASVSDALYQRLFTEIFQEYVGVAPPPGPEPAVDSSSPADASDLARLVGRYERTGRRYDVTLHDGRLRLVSTSTGALAAYSEPEPEHLDLLPVPGCDTGFVLRSHDREPWTWLVFDAFPDGTPYLYLGGRATPLRPAAR